MMHITSVGMLCPVGLHAEGSCAAIRAGIQGFQDLPYLDEAEQPVVGAAIPAAPPAEPATGMTPPDRLIKWLAMTARECLQKTPDLPKGPIPLLIALAEGERPGRIAQRGHEVLRDVQEALGITLHPTLSKVIRGGHTAGFVALQLARECLASGDTPACLVSGVDSYLNTDSLDWLRQQSRLKTSRNPNGLIPGEAAATVLVQRDPVDPQQLATTVAGLGFAREEATVSNEEPLLGLGLAQAARLALADAKIEMHQVDFRLTDLTGESYGFREQALMLGRLLRSRKEDFPVWHCADSIGDTGAAAGICQLVLAHFAFSKRYAPGARVICCTSTVAGDRAVAVLHGQSATAVAP